jgi:hypothetical protein
VLRRFAVLRFAVLRFEVLRFVAARPPLRPAVRTDTLRLRVEVLRFAVLRFAVLRLRVVVLRFAVLRFAVLRLRVVVLRFAVLRFAVLRLRVVVLRLAVLRLAVLRFAVLRLRVAVFRLAVLRFAVLRFAVVRLRVPVVLRRVELLFLREPLVRLLVPISSSTPSVVSSNIDVLLVRDLLDHLAGLRVVTLLGDVGLGQDSNQTPVFLYDGKAPDLVLRHQPKRLVEVLLRVDRDELLGGDLAHGDRLNVLALRDDADCDVTIRHDADEPVAFGDRYRTDVFGLHQPRGFDDR